MPTDPTPRPRGGPRFIRCDVCGRVEACTHADLLSYTQSGWPRCCGEVMALSGEPPKSGDDTATELPTLPPAGPP
jgi:hypothetical protein